MNKKIAALIMALAVFSSMSVAADFSDIENHWAEDVINELAQNGVIHGFEDNTVRPDEPVKVRDYIKMVLAANHKNIDFSSEYWSGEIIDYAIHCGYITENEFDNYDAYITRADMMKITAKSIGYSGEDYSGYLVENKIVEGDENGNLNPMDYLTRAESFAIIDRIMKSDEEYVPEATPAPFMGVIELTPETVTLTGSKIKIEENSPLNIGNFGLHDVAEWDADVPVAGTYSVTLLQARNQVGHKLGEFVVDNNQKIEFESVEMGNWSAYTEVMIGELELSEGAHHFSLTSTTEDNFMNLRKITLKDVNLYEPPANNDEVRVDIYPVTAELVGDDIRFEDGMITNWKKGNSAVFKVDVPMTGLYQFELTYENDNTTYGLGMITFSDNKKRQFITFKNDGSDTYKAGLFRMDGGENTFTIYPNPMSKTEELMRLKKITIIKEGDTK